MGSMPIFLHLSLVFLSAHSPMAAPARPKPALKAVTACVAATQADIQEALGEAVTKGTEHTEGSESTCDYAGDGGQVSITIHRSVGKLDVPSAIADLKAAMPDAKLREAPGIGARAFFVDLGGDGAQLFVIRDDREFLLVSVLGFGDATRVSPAAGRIARKALDRF
jgi:hypothetical protein